MKPVHLHIQVLIMSKDARSGHCRDLPMLHVPRLQDGFGVWSLNFQLCTAAWPSSSSSYNKPEEASQPAMVAGQVSMR
eukprot:CAMPEP_0195020018 /NCGR_PEP_ID=MMETSP0326_2-20130528/34193_1 /TAXON_ID=2866 ORGANISM="Crypthecodinium cohnii, Strain Seligo" /NCGR_SAMPLE_ID=MMETSP0326_2 /ASSEMBLY_ACC=CAM_ASM_000348 /LENGTH=77 /DNA_ID=CAMNT_0040038413 /DNA_START=118 /DNA_END=348 /DNA_ORIENTATION=-